MPPSERSQHPVWSLHSEFRTAKFNVFCYQDKIREIKNWNLFIEITIAITTPGSAIAGLFFWENPIGQWVWKILIIIAAIISVVKPFLKLPEKIEIAADIIKGYSDYFLNLKKLETQVEYKKRYEPEEHEEFLKILSTKKTTAEKEIDLKINEKIKKKNQLLVIKLFPTDQFFVPCIETLPRSKSLNNDKQTENMECGYIYFEPNSGRRFSSIDRKFAEIDPPEPWPRE